MPVYLIMVGAFPGRKRPYNTWWALRALPPIRHYPAIKSIHPRKYKHKLNLYKIFYLRKKGAVMTARAAMVILLLDGEVISVRNSFKWFGIFNPATEISKGIERKFGVQVSRIRKRGKTVFDMPCTWIDYRLNKTEYNAPGIAKMKAYLDHFGINVNELNTNSISQSKINFDYQ